MAEKITLEEALRENKELKAKIAELTEMVNYLQKQLFGKKAEKLSAGQLDLFDDKEQETAPTNDSTVEKLTTTVTSHQRKCKSKESRKEWLDCLEQVEELHQLSKQELTCDQCGQMMMVTANMNSIVKLNWFLPTCAAKSYVLKRLDANTVKIRKPAMMYLFRQRRHSLCFHTVTFQAR